MFNYIVRRMILLPITLFFIVLVNFVIINLAPGDPTSITEVSPEGTATRKADRGIAFGNDERYLQFREYYGLTLPILFNTWTTINKKTVEDSLWSIANQKATPESTKELAAKQYNDLRRSLGDKARFIMPHLLSILENPQTAPDIRRLAAQFFIRGGTHQAYLGPNITLEERQYNQKTAEDNNFLRAQAIATTDSQEQIGKKIQALHDWYEKNKTFYKYEPTRLEKLKIFFVDTRFFRYFSRVLTLNFGTLRNDDNKTVISEVVKRFKYSLTLSITPLLITFVLCQIFGFIMAYQQNKWPDILFNVIFLILYSIPIFVVAPFLIEMAINKTFPFTNIPIPISGFTSSDAVYNMQTSDQRLFDMLQHIFLPLVAVIYGSLAAQARLSRTAVLEVLRQDYVRTAKAKGLSFFAIMTKHVGRNAGITIVTSLASSLGIVLGGSLIVEILFEINGFGKFFYDAVINRDYNVIMFSTLAGSFLTLVGYLIADIAYTLLDPRLTLE